MKFPYTVQFTGFIPVPGKTKSRVVKEKFDISATSALDAQLKASRQVKFDPTLRGAYFPTYQVTCLEA